MKKKLAFIKKQLITLGGLRETFKLTLLGQQLLVDYNLRTKTSDRDYPVIIQLAMGKKCVFDVGANHGIISLLIAGQNKDAQIHSFEASEAAVNVINNHMRLNGFEQNIRVINSLIADRSGYVIPFYWEGSSGGASIVKNRLGHRTEIYKATLSLDDYADHFQLKPDFIKMDIEGAEGIAIKGMRKILESFRATVFIELHDFGNKKLHENANEIFQYVLTFQYKMIYLRTGLPLEDTDILKDRGRCHVVLVPNEEYQPSFVKSLNLDGL